MPHFFVGQLKKYDKARIEKDPSLRKKKWSIILHLDYVYA